MGMAPDVPCALSFESDKSWAHRAANVEVRAFADVAGNTKSRNGRYSGKLFCRATHARTSASASGSTALTSCTVMPALMRGSYSKLRMY
jgi:hypothetical protein